MCPVVTFGGNGCEEYGIVYEELVDVGSTNRRFHSREDWLQAHHYDQGQFGDLDY